MKYLGLAYYTPDKFAAMAPDDVQAQRGVEKGFDRFEHDAGLDPGAGQAVRPQERTSPAREMFADGGR